MARRKIIKLGMKNLPFVPKQEEFDWLAKYIDGKKDELYSVVFGYQMIDSILRILIFKRTGDKKLADQRGIERLIDFFKRIYPERRKLATDLYDWKEKRDSINHSLLFDERFSNAKQLDKFIKQTSETGADLYSTLTNILRMENKTRRIN